jgi:HlyD family secretion protein
VLRSPRELDEARVLDRPVSVGTRLAVNDHVMWVADVRPEKLVMRAQVDEDDVTKVRLGQTVQIVLYAYAGRPFQGKVTRISDKADPDRRTYEVDVAVTAPDPRFAAGMTGELAFEVLNKQGVPRVPTQAVQNGKVYAVRDGRVVATDAEVGVRALDKAEILSGLKAGERVLLSPIGEVGEGTRVRERFQPFPDAAAENKPKPREVGRFGA